MSNASSPASNRTSPSSAWESVSEAAKSAGSDAQETAKSTADDMRRQAVRFAQDVVAKTGGEQKERGAEALRTVARAIDKAADELEGQSPTIARTVHEAARQVEGFSNELANRDLGELFDQTARFARRQPALFVGGAVVAGFALARFLRTSGNGTSSKSTGYGSYPTGRSYDPYQS